MSVQHSAITATADCHEPKGLPDITEAGKVYVSNGSGSGTWTTLSRYANMNITAGATSLALTATPVRYDPGTEWEAGPASGVTCTIADGTMTILETGVYIVSFWSTFNTGAITAGAIYSFAPAIDGVVQARAFSVQKLTGGVDRLLVSGSGLVSLTAAQVLSFYASSSANDTITPIEAGFTIHKV